MEKAAKAKAKSEKQPKVKTSNKDEVVSFRCTSAELEPYLEGIKNSGGSKSKFFYELFIEKKEKVVLKEKRSETPDFKRYLFLMNNMSNNLNQVARLLNGLNRNGSLSEAHLMKALNTIQSIEHILLRKLDDN
jgi:hypothetical protein